MSSSLKFHTIKANELSRMIILLLKKDGKTYPFSFIFCKRIKKEDFVLKYPENQFPKNKSIEIEISEIPKELKRKSVHKSHISYNETNAPGLKFICFYPAKNHKEALEVAKFWARYNVRFLTTGLTSTEKEDVINFPLDEKITVLEII